MLGGVRGPPSRLHSTAERTVWEHGPSPHESWNKLSSRRRAISAHTSSGDTSIKGGANVVIKAARAENVSTEELTSAIPQQLDDSYSK